MSDFVIEAQPQAPAPQSDPNPPAPPVETPLAATPEPAWEDVLTNGRDVTQRLAVPGGWLYRTSWTHSGPFGLGGGGTSAAAAFVPATGA